MNKPDGILRCHKTNNGDTFGFTLKGDAVHEGDVRFITIITDTLDTELCEVDANQVHNHCPVCYWEEVPECVQGKISFLLEDHQE